VRNLLRGRITIGQFFEAWQAVASLPLVYLGLARDFWEPFEWYLKAESGLSATYFLIPFKRRAGDSVPGPHASRRATAYDITNLRDRVADLKAKGCEIGVHGLDAWHNAEKGRAELQRVGEVTGQSNIGIRMHWLLQDSRTAGVLEKAGFVYDSSAGYNETVGYRNGTTQVFRPLGASALLEVPLHIQDGALFYQQRMDLSESEAQAQCQPIIDHAIQSGGVLTLLWHDRSHAPERFWGDFYLRLLKQLKSLDVWFASAGQVVTWFRQRRDVRFERIETPDGVRAQLRYDGGEVQPPLRIRVHVPATRGTGAATSDISDRPWNGKSIEEVDLTILSAPATAVANPAS
jgi:hypothetical protein